MAGSLYRPLMRRSVFPLKHLPVFFLAAALAGATGCSLTRSAGESYGAEQLSAAEIQAAVDQVKPALVRIEVVSPDYYQGREEKMISFGSGAIITPEGHIVTNHHVAGKAIQLTCTMADKEEIPAVLIGTDPATDIAVIQLTPEEPRSFPTARFGDSDSMVVGDPVLALGSPMSISQSVTVGILSNAEMVMPPSYRGFEFELDGESVGELVRWFAHDAAIFPGNSGGPLVNLQGEIIGVNEIGLGLGGAIPGNLARDVAMEIMDRGYVQRAYFGMELQPLLAGGQSGGGVLIGNVVEDEPAHQAGVRAGDVLLSVNSAPVDGRFEEQLPAINNLLANQAVGEETALTVLRSGSELTLNVTPTEREPAIYPPEELKEWGMTARDISRFAAQEMALESTRGVMVTSTRPGGPVAKARPELRNRDVILEVAGQPVNSIEELQTITDEIVTEEGELVPTLVLFEREGEESLTVVDIGIEDLPDPAREVQKAWLPLETQVVTRDLAEQLGDPDLKGVRINRLYSNQTDDFPLQLGDIITAIDGDPLDASRPEDAELFRTWIRQYKIDSEVEFTVLRDGEEMTTRTQLMRSPQQVREMPRYRNLDFEFVARNAAFQDRQKPVMQGVDFEVVIDGVTSGGLADLAGLLVGDALLEIDGEPIGSLDELDQILSRAMSDRQPHVVFFVRSGAKTKFLELETPFFERISK